MAPSPPHVCVVAQQWDERMQALDGVRFGNLFGSPVLDHHWPESTGLNGQLREAILVHERASPGAALTNVGGWHSETGTLGFCGQAGKALVQRIMAMTNEATARLYADHDTPVAALDWTLSVWANVSRRGAFNKMHTHPWGHLVRRVLRG